jgi:hypothetical protein
MITIQPELLATVTGGENDGPKIPDNVLKSMSERLQTLSRPQIFTIGRGGRVTATPK